MKRQQLKEQYLEARQAYHACRNVFLSFLQNESDEATEYMRRHDVGDEGDRARCLRDRMQQLADEDDRYPAAPFWQGQWQDILKDAAPEDRVQRKQPAAAVEENGGGPR